MAVRYACVRKSDGTAIADGRAAFSDDLHRPATGGLGPAAGIATIEEAIAASSIAEPAAAPAGRRAMRLETPLGRPGVEALAR